RVDADLDLLALDVDLGVGVRGSFGQSGPDQAERHRVDRDVVAAPLLGQGLGQVGYARLRGGVVGLPGVATQSGDRRDVDDLAAGHRLPVGLRLLHRRGDHRLRGPQDPERRLEVHVQDGVPLLVGHLLHDRVPRVAGVVDDDVQSAELLDRGVDEPLGEAVLGDTADTRDGLATGFGDGGNGLLGRSLVQVVDHDRGAVTGQLAGDLGTDAAPGSADDGDLAVQLPHVFLLL